MHLGKCIKITGSERLPERLKEIEDTQESAQVTDCFCIIDLCGLVDRSECCDRVFQFNPESHFANIVEEPGGNTINEVDIPTGTCDTTGSDVLSGTKILGETGK